jgi:putative hydrolase of the HAD superfamily
MSKILPTKKTAETVLKKLLSASDLQAITKHAKVVLMVGMPGSGKSTISQLLASAYGFWRFSSDQIRMEELFPDQSHRVANEHDKVMLARYQVYQELSRRVSQAVQRGQRVVVDSTNLDDKRAMLMKSLLEVTQPESIAFVCVKTPEQIMKGRFKWEGEDSAQKWLSVYDYWKGYLDEGKASYPTPKEYPGTHVCSVKRYDLETFDWITEIGVIVWDVDRTLYQPVPQITGAIQDFLLSHIQEKFSITKQQAQEKFHEEYERLHSSTLSLDAMGFDGRELIDQAFQNIDLETHLQPDPKLKKLFQNLNQFHHVILTNATRKATERKLKALGLPLKLFSEIYATYELPVIKPDPKVFQHVIKQTNFSPHQHLMVGDELKTDILPAKAAGMRTARIGSTEGGESTDIFFKNVYGVGRLFGIEIKDR